VHAKALLSQEFRALLAARRLPVEKLRDVENSPRGILRGFGPKLGPVGEAGFAARAHEPVAGRAMLEAVAASLLSAREAVREQCAQLQHTLAVPRAQHLRSAPRLRVATTRHRSGEYITSLLHLPIVSR
jgi:transposase